MMKIKLTILRMALIIGIILFIPLALYNQGDMAVLSIFGVFILIAIGVMMEKERRKQQKNTKEN